MTSTGCVERLGAALAVLAPDCPATEVNRIAALVDEAMSGPERAYHTLPHALMVAGSDDPIEILIGLFHDIVQLDTDAGIPPSLENVLHDFTTTCAEQSSDDIDAPDHRQISCVHHPSVRPPDRWTTAVQTIFRIAPDAELTRVNGHNEFLSALVAARSLEPWLDAAAMIGLVAGIETTIPFRSDPRSSLHELRESIRRLNQENPLGLDTDQVDTLLRRAVRVANRDVQGFSDTNLAAFLGDTFTLLMESCPSRYSAYTVRLDAYRRALQKMTKFLSSISAAQVFRQFIDEPALTTHHDRQRRAAFNLQVVVIVLSARLLSTILLEAELGDDKPALSLISSPSPHPSTSHEEVDSNALELLSSEAGWRWRSAVSPATVEVDMLNRWGGDNLLRKSAEIQALVARHDVARVPDVRRELRTLILSHYTHQDREWAQRAARLW